MFFMESNLSTNEIFYQELILISLSQKVALNNLEIKLFQNKVWGAPPKPQFYTSIIKVFLV